MTCENFYISDCGTNNNTQVEFRQYLVKKSTECLVQEDVSVDLIKMSAWVCHIISYYNLIKDQR